MRRATKRVVIFLSGLLFTGLYCEFLIYYIVILQCTWPHLNSSDESLKALIIADPHLLGPRRGHWLDKLRREWQMHIAFQTIMTIHQPEVVFVLGDLFDEGEWSTAKQFTGYVDRFLSLFDIDESVEMHVVAGNHDTGFHNNAGRATLDRFSKLLNSPPVQLITIKGNHFVMINSMAMQGDRCRLCTEARKEIINISKTLNCYKDPLRCHDQKFEIRNYSRPILLQHFPLYRISDSICNESDAPPSGEKDIPFRSSIDALSEEATEFLVTAVKPRVAFGGHTHHGCLVEHKDKGIHFLEYSVPSFSWRNRPDPKYMLVTITPDAYDVYKCGLPKETTIAVSAITLILIFSLCTIRIRTPRHRKVI